MPCKDFNTYLFSLPDDCKEIVTDECIQFHLPQPAENPPCPACGATHTRVNDYHKQILKGIPDTATQYIYRVRRYRCPFCGKTFPEKRPFIDKYQRMPHRVIQSIISEHGELVTTSYIAHKHGISPSTVMRHFAKSQEAHEETANHNLPTILSMDEFRGNVGAKYQVVLNDLEHRSCCAILKDRTTENLYKTILEYPKEEREKVLLASIDLCAFFRKLIEECFPNAEIIADKFHAVRLANNALDVIRKQEQEKIDPADKKWFKNSRHVLLGRKKKLKEKDKAKLIKMLGFSVKLAHAHEMKEDYFSIFDSETRQEYKKKLQDFADKVEKYDIDEFRRVLRTTQQWKEEIWLGIQTGYNNGFTEGCNNTIKVLKRICYGFRSIVNFRRRILFILNNKLRQARRSQPA